MKCRLHHPGTYKKMCELKFGEIAVCISDSPGKGRDDIVTRVAHAEHEFFIVLGSSIRNIGYHSGCEYKVRVLHPGELIEVR